MYEGKSTPAMTAQKVNRLQCELHKTHLCKEDDLRSHLYHMFDIKNKLADLGAPVNDLQMVDKMLRSLPTQTCFDELRRKVLFSSCAERVDCDAVSVDVLALSSVQGMPILII